MVFTVITTRCVEERLVVAVVVPVDRVGRDAALAVEAGVAVERLDEPGPDLGLVDHQPAVAGHVVGPVGVHELPESVSVSPAATDMGRPTPQTSSRPVALRTAGWTLSHQKDQNGSHSFGTSASVRPARSSRLFQTWTWLVIAPHRQRVEAAPARGRVEQGGAVERVLVELGRQGAERVREVDEPALVGPLGRSSRRGRCRTGSRAGARPRARPRSCRGRVVRRAGRRARRRRRSSARRRRR